MSSFKSEDVQSSSNYRRVKLMKRELWTLDLDKVTICELQYGFMPRKSATDTIVTLWMLIGKWRGSERTSPCLCGFRKTDDRVPKKEL